MRPVSNALDRGGRLRVASREPIKKGWTKQDETAGEAYR